MELHSLVPAFLDTCLGLDATQRQLMMQDYAVVIEKEIKTSTDEDDDKSPLPVKRLPIQSPMKVSQRECGPTSDA